jgi:predicted nuclease of restriction endonuclease-like (RecB) superfamily
MLPGELHDIAIVGTPSPLLQIPPEKLVYRLSYSHLELITDLDDPLKRIFYEIECIRGNWSVRELKRQIGSLYYERSGLSKNKEKLAELAQSGKEKSEPKLAIRDPYVFEFLGIKSREVMRESDLEDQLLDKLQIFFWSWATDSASRRVRNEF